MSAWVLILFLVAPEGGASSIAVDMPDFDKCIAAKQEAVDSVRGEETVKLAMCVKRAG